MKKIIYIIGIGGRTGSMFGYELKNAAEIIGVGQDREIQTIRNKQTIIQRNNNLAKPLTVKTISSAQFGGEIDEDCPDFIWLAVRNPVTDAVKQYYSYFKGKEKIPALILSQNGLSAIDDVKVGLTLALGQDAEKVKIVRVSLINGIDLKTEKGVSAINYKIPIKLGFGTVALVGPAQLENGLGQIFGEAGFKTQEFFGKDVLAMENAKLFTNLIGMAAAIQGVSADDGWRDKQIFAQEISMLKEFVLVVNAGGGSFVTDLCGYPIKLFSWLVQLPVALLVPFRGIFAQIIAKGRNRPKDLSEIDYYNGEVVKLGKKSGIATPTNQRIVVRAKEILSSKH